MKKNLISQLLCVTVFTATASAIDPGTLYRNTIPEDKNLDPAWVQSLSERGHALDAGISGSKAEDTLKYIGMPVSGIATGTVYLNGDGRLFVWDIWSAGHQGVLPNLVPPPKGYSGFRKQKGQLTPVSGSTYINPLTPEAFPPSFSQGFGLRWADGNIQQFAAADWESVEFTGTWPVATVDYADSKSPLQVELKAYSPFVPLNLQDSSIPVTVMSYTLTNTSSDTVQAELVGWLENMSNTANADTAGAFSIQPEWTSLSHACAMFMPSEKRGKRQSAPFHAKGSMTLSYLGTGERTAVNEVPGIATVIELKPGESREYTFLISWHFADLRIKMAYGPEWILEKNAYAERFEDADAVAEHVAANFDSLSSQTRAWVQTWNDSTLPQWLLDRTVVTLNTLQTANCNLLADGDGGRFWAWEGVRVCHGTCTHVWHYAQAMARLFPSLERNLREKTDYGTAQLENGVVPYRGTIKAGEGGGIAIDGQCGTVLRSYREHLISKDDTFLKNNWADIKRALEYLIDFDRNDGDFDGLLHGKQHNTLDASWYGKVHAISSLYIAALRAGEEMARRMDDREFEVLCRELYEKGSQGIEKLYNGEYYVQEEDPAHSTAIGVGEGVYIDQVIGQFWANQLGLGRLYNEAHIQSALNALWRYNFVPDVKAFRETFRKGRYYAWDGDAGLIMSSWPNGGLKDDFMNHWQYDYFNECMSGFEYQAAAHMVAEGTPELVERGLAITRAIHDRYRPQARNPYNEIECSDHYARAMSSYAVFLAVCGFNYDGPAGVIGFDPAIQADDFRAPFTAAAGWGTYSQKITPQQMQAELKINWGQVRLSRIKLNPGERPFQQVSVSLNGKKVAAELLERESGVVIALAEMIQIAQGQQLTVVLR
ncbi:GH116 family glycosyl hydrolase [Coraliomargarita algicola]|uniref:GH116 family glycosyl hydrolase n=1 Tax=Coraliomargarita algicola TaxID=3092156 RepID=A0ABZ0RJ30_9BACT|nr:GH116 family glycosyl hydrolase [Coraliomargarita sp. J2-16]WPJ95478.1 GH116 family glycosyl hydrolase [Coraliomargarita sp. J2-16]